MNGIDIKNLAILTEALRGRNTHTQYSREVFRTGRQFDDDSIILNIYFDVYDPQDEWDDEYPYLDDPDILKTREQSISEDRQIYKIGQDPISSDFFIVAHRPARKGFAKKFYFDPQYTLKDIIDRGVAAGVLLKVSTGIIMLSIHFDLVDTPNDGYLIWLRSLGVDINTFDLFENPYKDN